MRAAAAALLLALAFVAPATIRAYAETGVVYIDEASFDLVIDGSRDVFLRLEKEYAWGDEHNAFKKLAEIAVQSGERTLIASLPYSTTSDKPRGKNFADKMGVSELGMPAYFFYKKGSSTPVVYKGYKKRAEDVLHWLAEQTGGFYALPGQLKDFDTLARTAVQASTEADRQSLLDRARQLAEGVQENNKTAAEYYVKVFEKLVATPEWAKTETARLKKLADDSKMSEKRREDVLKRVNALSAFTWGWATEEAASKMTVEEAIEKARLEALGKDKKEASS